MISLDKETFVCLDCETTGLDIEKDQIIEIALVKFNLNEVLDSFETLVNPLCEIPQESQDIHHISQDMVSNKPTIKEFLPKVVDFIKDHIIVGHGVQFDVSLIEKALEKNSISSNLKNIKIVDTLRLARLYGQCPVNSLEKLRVHFNIEETQAHRAMNDVMVNIEVFKYLTKNFPTTQKLLSRLNKPVLLKTMPLGKHKGRHFNEIPLDYLKWAASKDFDMDLLYSIRKEINTRKKNLSFERASNPFSEL